MATTAETETPSSLSAIPDPTIYPQTVHLRASNVHILLTDTPLSPTTHLSKVHSASAGANVLFTGTTRNTFNDRPVARLSYTCYASLALKTLTSIAEHAVSTHNLLGVSIAHRIGEVPVGEESIVIAVSAAHRGAAWRAGESVLEECKAKVEIWKREEFEGEDPEKTGEWRSNTETDADGNPISS